MSVPAAKERPPAPVMMRALTGPGTDRLAQISPRRSYIANVRALWAVGRLKVATAISPSTAYSSSSLRLPLIWALCSYLWNLRPEARGVAMLAQRQCRVMHLQLTAKAITVAMVASIAQTNVQRTRFKVRFFSD